MQIVRHISQARRAWCIGLLLCGAVSAGILSRLSAELTPAGARERQVTLKVVDFLSRQHISRQALDDAVAVRALKLLLSSFDPMKVYFTQSDVDEFRGSQTQLDNLLREGNIEFAYHVYRRFLKRVDERVILVNKLLEQPFDFTADEVMITDPDATEYSRTPDEIAERWRKRIKYDLLVLKADKVEEDKARERLRNRYHNFARRMQQFDNDELLETYLNSFSMALDPHTSYMSPSQFDNFRILMRLNLEGIGAKLQTNDFGQTVVAEVVPGGAAAKHGKLKPEDQIVAVGQGDSGEMVDVVDMKLTDVVKLIRGKAGTVVRLGVKSEGDAESSIYRIVRAQIELKDSEAQAQILEAGKNPAGEPYRVGVILLPSFYMDMEGSRLNQESFKSTTRDVKLILDSFKEQNVDAVVLDLRRNGGGSLVEAINLTGLFIDEGPIVQVKDSAGAVDHYDDTSPGMLWGGPLVVVTDKFSASASEILAGAIQDYRRGLIVGDRATHGKGTVQTLRELGERLFSIANPPNEGAIKITVQQFFRPSGDSTQQRGVLADIQLPALTDYMPVGEADLENSLPFSNVKAAAHAVYDMVSPDIVQKLAARSSERITTSDEFRKVAERIERYKEQKAQKSVSLNADKFMSQRNGLNDDEAESGAAGDHVKIKRDYYLEEVLSVTVDYLDLLHAGQVAQSRTNR
jgi:carboxyl-terminal processing protease